MKKKESADLIKKKTLNKIYKDNKKHAKLFEILPIIHEETIQEINCLDCAACCKNYSPRFKTTDIKRLSILLKIKQSQFIEKFLNIDSDGDFVLKKLPCPFLNSNNKCQIYNHRPSDCQRFPYSNEDTFIKRHSITSKNINFCAIADKVLEKIINQYQNL